MARTKASKNDNLIDPALKKTFIDMRDHFKSLDDRANGAAAKRRQYLKEVKEAGYTLEQFKISLQLETPEGEADFKKLMSNRLLAAAYSDADIGDQLSLFLDGDRTPAVDRAYKEGQSSAMKNEAAVPKYDPSTPQYEAFMQGYHEEQGRQVKTGIGKLDAKKANGKPEKAAKGTGKRGRPPGSGKAKAAPAKAAKPAKADAGPPRRPSAAPVTRATLAAQKAAPSEDADSYFSKSKPAGNA